LKNIVYKNVRINEFTGPQDSNELMLSFFFKELRCFNDIFWFGPSFWSHFM